MNIQTELEKLLDNYKIEKKLDEIQNILINKDFGYSSSGLWIFALLAMMYNGFGTSVPQTPTSITNIYQEEKKEANEGKKNA